MVTQITRKINPFVIIDRTSKLIRDSGDILHEQMRRKRVIEPKASQDVKRIMTRWNMILFRASMEYLEDDDGEMLRRKLLTLVDLVTTEVARWL